MKNVVAGNPGNYAMTELSEIEQALVGGGDGRVCSGPTVCEGNGTGCEDRQGPCRLK